MYSQKLKEHSSVVLLGILIIAIHSYHLATSALNTLHFTPQQETIQAKITSQPQKKHRFMQCKAKTIPDQKEILIKWPHTTTPTDIHYGHTITFKGKTQHIDTPSNPGQFDYASYLKKKNIWAVYHLNTIISLEKTLGAPIKHLAYYLKNKIIDINQKTLPAPYANLYIGLVFGEHGIELPKPMHKQFKKIGLTHLLVVSGAQVALLTGIIAKLCQWATLSLRTTYIILSLSNLLFFLITGGEASILRACLMNQIAYGLKFLKRNSNMLHILSITASIMLIINPKLLYNTGAYLSFLATTSLLYGVPKIRDTLPQKWSPFLKENIAFALAPFLFTAPLLLSKFNTLSPVSLLSNFLLVWAVEYLVVIGFFSTLTGFIALPITQIINHSSTIFLNLLMGLVTLLNKIPFATVSIKNPHPIFPALVFSGVFLPFILDKKYVQKYKLFLIASLSIIVIYAITPSSMLTFTSIDIGQGDATLIETPSGKTILIDTGKTADYALLPLLTYKGINKIDMLIITHFDSDHVGGAATILNEIPVGTLIDNGNHHHAPENYLNNRSKAKQYIQAKAKQSIPIEKDVTLTLYSPPKSHVDLQNKNNQSIVSKLTYKDIDFLITGDLEKEGENWLLNHYGHALDIEVLKLGHHGSKTSSQQHFLLATSPILSISSQGRHNRYHHPHLEVTQRLSHLNIPHLSTQKNGAIEIKSNGKELFYKTYRKPVL